MDEVHSTDEALKPFNWWLLYVLVAALLLSVILLTPYALTMQKDVLKTVRLPLPLPILVPLQWIGSSLLYGLLAGIGLVAAQRIGRGLPFLEGWLAGNVDWHPLKKIASLAANAGVLTAVAILVLDKVLFAKELATELSKSSAQNAHVAAPPWSGFLASFYGGITEEILCRLFLLSLIAWGLSALKKAPRPSLMILWTANILSAVLFGLRHLPAVAALGVHIDLFIVLRSIVLNGLGGLVFGWFYWTYGLESAMISHFSGDLVLHVLWPMVGAR